MPKPPIRPRKKRTRQHVIADLSLHYVEGFILAEGHTAQVVERDYGYDLMLFTYDEHGYVEPGVVFIQLKASEVLPEVGNDYVFDLNVRDYNLWTLEKLPVVLVLYDASRRRAYWLHIQGYFGEDESRRPKKHAKSVRVRVPKRQPINRRAVAAMRELKRDGGLRVVRGE
jgi:hypothetical protein